MKKLLILTLFLLLSFSSNVFAQKMQFSLANARTSGSFFLVDLKVNVLAGQSWHVGASNIRVNLSSVPAGVLTVKADNPVLNANPNLNSGIYQAMTTTSVASGAAIGLNILTFASSGFYTFTPGTYTLGTLRFNITGTPFTNSILTFRIPPEQFPSAINDSLVALVSGTGYTILNPPPTFTTNLVNETPKEFALYQNYPNPFNPVTRIKFDVPSKSLVKIIVYDITGKEIEILNNSEMEPGSYETNFDARKLASGVYFYKMETNTFSRVMKMIVLK